MGSSVVAPAAAGARCFGKVNDKGGAESSGGAVAIGY
jgi:hypothetical protein